MMNFELLEASIIELLGNAEAGRFRTVGYQKQGQEAFHVKDTDRSVQVYYSEGNYPKSAGSLNGPVMHDMTFNLDLTVSMPAKGDLATLENPNATAPELQAALASLQIAEFLVNQSWNDLAAIVYQILMDARNLDLGLAPIRVANRWVDQPLKDPVLRRGELVVLTGSMKLTARMPEELLGDAGIPFTVIDTEIEIDGDPIGRAGVRNEHDVVVEDGTGDVVTDPETGNYVGAE
jgi:hypothetical protein